MSTHTGAERPVEAKDVGAPDVPMYDLGAALGNRRQAFIAGMGTLIAIATSLVLAVALIVQLYRNRYVPVPVRTRDNGTLSIGADYLVADSILFHPEEVADFAKAFVELRFEYDYRAGIARILAARSYVQKGFAEAAFPSRDQVDRLDAQQTVVTLTHDSTAVRPLPTGIFEVTLVGRKTLQNVQYTSALGPRTTPFKEVITVAKVQRSPAFTHGLAIRGAKGDLEP